MNCGMSPKLQGVIRNNDDVPCALFTITIYLIEGSSGRTHTHLHTNIRTHLRMHSKSFNHATVSPGSSISKNKDELKSWKPNTGQKKAKRDLNETI